MVTLQRVITVISQHGQDSSVSNEEEQKTAGYYERLKILKQRIVHDNMVSTTHTHMFFQTVFKK